MTPHEKRYNETALRLLTLLNENAATLKPIEWRGAVFPWDIFTAANPTANDLLLQVQREMNYELSELQCSWAAVQFCIGIKPAPEAA